MTQGTIHDECNCGLSDLVCLALLVGVFCAMARWAADMTPPAGDGQAFDATRHLLFRPHVDGSAVDVLSLQHGVTALAPLPLPRPGRVSRLAVASQDAMLWVWAGDAIYRYDLRRWQLLDELPVNESNALRFERVRQGYQRVASSTPLTVV